MKVYEFRFYKDGEFICKKLFKAKTESAAMHMADAQLKWFDKYDDWELVS